MSATGEFLSSYKGDPQKLQNELMHKADALQREGHPAHSLIDVLAREVLASGRNGLEALDDRLLQTAEQLRGNDKISAAARTRILIAVKQEIAPAFQADLAAVLWATSLPYVHEAVETGTFDTRSYMVQLDDTLQRVQTIMRLPLQIPDVDSPNATERLDRASVLAMRESVQIDPSYAHLYATETLPSSLKRIWEWGKSEDTASLGDLVQGFVQGPYRERTAELLDQHFHQVSYMPFSPQ